MSRLQLARWSDLRRTRWLGVSIAGLAALAIVVDIYVVGAAHSNRWTGAPLEKETPAATYYQEDGGRYDAEVAHFPWRNVGNLGCYDAIPWTKSTSLWAGPVAQVHVRAADGAESPLRAGDSLEKLTRTNNTLHFEISLESPARVIVNQNWDFDWESPNSKVVADEDRLAFDLPAGRSVIHAAYRPKDLPWSVLATFVGILACFAVIFRTQVRVLVDRFGRLRKAKATPTA
jgi:hypothetical protein